MNQFCSATMIARTTLGTHNLRVSAQTVTHRLREIGERPPYTMYVLYGAFLFWPSISQWRPPFCIFNKPPVNFENQKKIPKFVANCTDFLSKSTIFNRRIKNKTKLI